MNEVPHGLDDPYRLPQHVRPTRYHLILEPDLVSATFQGRATIALTVLKETRVIVCNALELAIGEAVVEAGGRRQTASVTLDESLQRCRMTVPEPLAPGAWQLHVGFRGILNDKLRGFYRSTYTDQRGSQQTIAATQFEATDARRAFPCWDEPSFKAVFSTTLVIDENLTAVSNSLVVSETREKGKKIVRFADTIKMSTYLVAFVVGRMEGSAPSVVGNTRLQLWTVPGKTHLTSFGQDIAAASLHFFERYYDIPYPGD